MPNSINGPLRLNMDPAKEINASPASTTGSSDSRYVPKVDDFHHSIEQQFRKIKDKVDEFLQTTPNGQAKQLSDNAVPHALSLDTLLKADCLDKVLASLNAMDSAVYAFAVVDANEQVEHVHCNASDIGLDETQKSTLLTEMFIEVSRHASWSFGRNSSVKEVEPKDQAQPDNVVLRRNLAHMKQEYAAGIGLPLPAANSKIALLRFSNQPLFEIAPDLANALQASVDTIGLWLAAKDFAKRKAKKGLLKQCFSRGNKTILLSIVAVIGVLLIPVPYLPRRECVIEPAHRQFISAPIEGQLKQSFVRAGDEVVAGQVIATINEESLERQHAVFQADLESALKKQVSAMATHSGADLRIARNEEEQARLKIEDTEKKLTDLQIKSPVDGIVVRGDWFGNDNMSVTLGQSMFEIAPLETMTAEIHLTAHDLPLTKVGNATRLVVDSVADKVWTGKVARIEPRGEVINDKVVFIAEFDVENFDHKLMPGMKAAVRLSNGYRSIGWILFHQPYCTIRNWLCW